MLIGVDCVKPRGRAHWVVRGIGNKKSPILVQDGTSKEDLHKTLKII